ncbi:hypothetical protein F441_03418 [Phytophthora nicotianae CJ01A1]|uniref:Centriolar satellite-associated tubulin polyglutamylase complex regulator 1 n=3 Tax=Phytophthora nicotianae TaxID=4792 RepID=W2PC93_PHYN3|nr:hypothetical protein PPTG_19496 [Phytophthora nicotianae INRA-310]ETK93534.1 hypothetical protein L915_03307 [Phytophthora nicotianae]ETL46930.1 hypothetical protein L916_03274 [Phytophthora nicotianae]ETM98456.1 hypothetical protein PPTG_19496 [Phytophthora nicotianae INRA-310]ETP23467.1 hypothetical protein F441_03418 [Phytophthora nicotianae CJ01A1]
MSAPTSRLQAERLIASAYRIPLVGNDGAGDIAAPTVSSGSKLRTLTRLPSRNSTSSSEFYLQQSGVQFYVDDLVRQLQDKRPDQPAQFIASYFSAVAKGSNVKSRPYEYINGCLQNRVAFLAQLQRSYAKIDHEIVLSVGDFTEMLRCQCRDLPTQLILQATCHLVEDQDGQRRASLQTFLAAFSACFFFNGKSDCTLLLDTCTLMLCATMTEFLNKTHDIYNENSAAKDSNSIRSESVAHTVIADRVIARFRVVVQQNTYAPMSFVQYSSNASATSRFIIPPMIEVEKIVVKSSGFKEFCRLFYESPALAGYILNLQVAFQKLTALAK